MLMASVPMLLLVIVIAVRQMKLMTSAKGGSWLEVSRLCLELLGEGVFEGRAAGITEA